MKSQTARGSLQEMCKNNVLFWFMALYGARFGDFFGWCRPCPEVTDDRAFEPPTPQLRIHSVHKAATNPYCNARVFF